MTRYIVGIGHKKRTGKDFFAKLLKTELESKFSVKIEAFADPIKDAAYSIFNPYGLLNKEYYENNPGYRNIPLDEINLTPRQIWIEVGKAMRNIHDNIWIDQLFNKFARPVDILIITDVRFPKEVEAIKERNGKLIKIERPSVEKTNDEADCALDGFNCWNDIIVNNDIELDLKDIAYKISCNIEHDIIKGTKITPNA